MAASFRVRGVHCICRFVSIKPAMCKMQPVVSNTLYEQKSTFVRFSSNSSSKMSAWQIHQYGGIDELSLSTSARPATIKSPNELLVKVHAASINPIDVRMIGGYGRALINVMRMQQGVTQAGTEFPLTLGRDFSGTVIETGRDVRKFEVGDEVFGAIGVHRPGTHAQYTVLSQDEISLKPKNVSHIEAASLPYVAMTTWAGLCTVGELKERRAPGKRLLIFGGSGGIGTFCIQLAKAWGMHVTTTCSTDAMDLVREMGADEAIDYKTKQMWIDLENRERFDYILDTLGGEWSEKGARYLSSWQNSKLITLVSPVLKNSDSLGVVPGILKTAVSAGMDTLKGLRAGKSIRWAVFVPNGSAMEKVRQMVEAEQIKPVVHEVFPFKEVPSAYKRVSDGHLRGKVVIDTLAQS